MKDAAEDLSSDTSVCFCNAFCFMVSLFKMDGAVEYEKINSIMWRAQSIDFMVVFRRPTGFVEIHPVPDIPGYVPKKRDASIFAGRTFGHSILVMDDHGGYAKTSKPFSERAQAFAAFSELARGFTRSAS